MSTQPDSVIVPTLKMGDRLRVIRREYLGKLSQQEMADLLGVPRDRYAQWESGNSEPRMTEAKRIANLLQAEARISAAWTLGVWEMAPSPDGGGSEVGSGKPFRNLEAVGDVIPLFPGALGRAS